MYLLQLVQALKYESFSDIQGGLDPGSKRDSQGLSDDGALDRYDKSNHHYVNTTNICNIDLFPYLHHAGKVLSDLFALLKEAAMKPQDIVLQQFVLQSHFVSLSLPAFD